jgi:hypothetical protein
MNRFIRTVFCANLFSAAAVVHAQAPAPAIDPLWAKVVEQVNLSKQWVAQDIDLQSDADVGGTVRKMHSKSHLTGWEKAKPVYTATQIEPVPDPAHPSKPGDDTNIDFNRLTDLLLAADAPVTRVDDQLLHGRKWALFRAAKSQGPIDIKMQVWVDPVTGLVHHIESHIHVMLTTDMVSNSTFAVQAGAGNQAQQVDSQVEILVPFKHGKIHLTSTNSNWAKRPL